MFAEEIKNKIVRSAVLIALLTMFMIGNAAVTGMALENNIVPALIAGKTGTLTVCYRSNENGKAVPLKDVDFEICQVSDLTVRYGSAKYALLPEFSSTGITFEGMTASDSNAAAKKLRAFIKQNGINMTAGKTDANGCAVFSDLKPGMYLVVQSGTHRQGDRDYISEPFLVSVPLAVDGGNGTNVWKYNVTAYPKHSSSMPIEKPLIPPSPKTGDLFLLGFWGCVLIVCAVGLKTVFMGKERNAQR